MTTSLRDGVVQHTGGRGFLGEANLALTVINCNCKRSDSAPGGGTCQEIFQSKNNEA